MSLGSRKSRLLAATSALAVASTLALGAGSPATAERSPQPRPATAVPAAHPGSAQLPTARVDAKLAPGLQSGRHRVFVQLSGRGAADAAASARGHSGKVRAAKAARARTSQQADQVTSRARAADGRATRLFEVGNAVPGVALSADAAALRSIAQMSQVVKISPLVPKKPVNSNGEELTNVLKTWQDTGTLGAGVTVGVIDTGTDYTHADFGGPGTQAAWDAAHADNDNPDWLATLEGEAKAKVVGGYDFAGDDYNADPEAEDYQPVPHPDPDPIDCYGHGSHVAGIVAGYGENADGSTFTGDYSALTHDSLNAMKIGPGMAPAAAIYSLKVFGCTGSTDVVIEALDRALDPNGDGDFADHLDIVNLSLGSDYAPVDDPENAVIDELAAHGVLPVIAMGNNGDLTDTGGSPGNAVRSLAVASSVDDFQQLDGLRVDAPADVAGNVAGQNSVAYDWAHSAPVTGDVVALSDPSNADGCDALSAADAAAVTGKVAWLTWDSNDATRRCGSAGRSANVKAAGAIGAVFTGDVNPFTAGITGDADIPVFQLTTGATAKLQPALDAGTLRVTFDGSLALSVADVDPSITDLISSFSSRGTHGSLGVVKPDVAAPGDTIVSVGVGLGTGGLSESGTSMATPHTAGIAALVAATHPSWSTEQLKADIMNTAGHDVYTEAGQQGHVYGPARVGAGRVDARAAVGNQVLAYSADVPGGVSASFGVVAVPADQASATRSRVVTLENTGATPVTLQLSYDPVVEQPGVSYSVSPASVTLAAGASTTATVTMAVDTAALRRTIDPTMATEQLGVGRQFVADASGRLLVAGAGVQPLRVPVYGAVKPASTTSASAVTLGQGRKATSAIGLTGQGFAQGSGSEAFTSLVSVMTLGARSPQLPPCGGDVTAACTVNQTAVSGDLKYVGAGSSPTATGYADGWLWFGIATYGDWATIGNSVIPYVDFDTTGDGTPDYEVYVQNYPATDLLVANLVDLASGELIDLEPVNVNFGDVDTNVFDTNVLTIPVWPALIGVKDGAKRFPITYRVGTFSSYGMNPNGDIDSSAPVRYDVVRPPVAVDSPLWLDQGGTAIPVGNVGVANPSSRNCKQNCPGARADALVLHLHGVAGHRAEVVRLP
ncbi:MAG TPA: S8 family serine peptidase [Marmoricola sp.]|nr:S8 family serine peptidase [Marmoricola sp.]